MSKETVALRWLDFELHAVLGPLLEIPEEEHRFRRTRFDSPSVMEDAIELKPIQETGQKQWLARMAGLSDSDSLQTDSGRDAHRVDRAASLRTPEEGE